MTPLDSPPPPPPPRKPRSSQSPPPPPPPPPSAPDTIEPTIEATSRRLLGSGRRPESSVSSASIEPTIPPKSSRQSGRQTRASGIVGPPGEGKLDLRRTQRARVSLNATVLAAPDTGELSGEPAERYRIDGELARGGMGAIMKCFDVDVRREVAMKVMLDAQPSDVKRVRFLEEAQVTGQLEHPNIVPVHDVGTNAEGHLFFTMKLVKGRSLKQVLAQTRADILAGRGDARFPLTKRLDVFKRICEAIAFAHSRGVIHRDLKPENVMVGEFGEVQVMDWGIAKIIGRPDRHGERLVISDRQEDGIARTMDGAVAGTPAYMPPEQARGEIEKLDERADVYSLGAILYELLTFAPPFAGGNVFEILAKVCQGRLMPPSERVARDFAGHRGGGPTGTRSGKTSRAQRGASSGEGRAVEVPRELETVVLCAMETDRRRRYQSADELCAEIEAFLDGRTLASVEYSPWELVVRWVKRHKTAAVGSAAMVLVVVAATLAMIVMARAADEKARFAEERTKQEQRDEAISRAVALMDDAKHELARATVVPFNEADPQDYFLARLAVARHMGQAVQHHPEPPAEWKRELATLTEELQQTAQRVGDWALAAHFAGSAHDWGAISKADQDARLAAVATARRTREDEDRQRLLAALDRIAAAETSTPEQNALVPGELGERARQVARVGGTKLTGEILKMLADDSAAREAGKSPLVSALQRRFLIDLLGRRNDVLATHDGMSPAQTAHRILANPSPWMSYDEVVAWLWLAARLQAQHRCYEVARVGELLPRESRELGGRYHSAVNAADDYVDIATNPAEPLPPPTDSIDDAANPFADNTEFLDIVEHMGDWVASSAASASAYTRVLLDLAERPQMPDSRPLSDRQFAFVLNQIGLRGDTRPPDADEPERTPLAVLHRMFAELPEEWLPNARPFDAPPEAWQSRRFRATVAALNIARLGDGDFARILAAKRATSRQHSIFWVRTQLAIALLPIGDWQPESFNEFMQRTSLMIAQGDLANAERDLTAALEGDENAALYTQRSRIFQIRGENERALADLNRAVQMAPDSAEIRVARANFSRRLGRAADAIADLNAAIAANPGFVPAYINRGALRSETGDWRGALADFDRVESLDPEVKEIYINRGVVQAQLGRLSEALRDFEIALRMEPNNHVALTNRGWVRARLGDTAGAMADFDAAIRLAPAHFPAYENRGHLRMAQGDHTGAIDDFDECVRLNPNSSEALTNRAAAHLSLNNDPSAVEDARAAIAIEPRRYSSHLYLGIALARLGQRQPAEQAFADALALAPDENSRALVLSYRRQVLGH